MIAPRERIEAPADPFAFYEFSLAEGFGDGLPLLPPTEERVSELLAATSHAPDDVLGLLAPHGGPATIEKVAVNAAMAGCERAAFPYVVAAIEAILEPELAVQVDKLREGMWVEMTQDDGEKVRCKIAAVIQPTGKFIFVNRRGMKVAEKTRMALAVELKRKSVTPLDEAQVFDRALEAVIGNLRQMQQKPVPA